jgi:hypothetical protein
MNAGRWGMGDGKHPDKDIRAFLATVEAAGWVVVKASKYFKCKCPCGLHMKWVHLTPSGAQYLLNTRKWFERQPCWKG